MTAAVYSRIKLMMGRWLDDEETHPLLKGGLLPLPLGMRFTRLSQGRDYAASGYFEHRLKTDVRVSGRGFQTGGVVRVEVPKGARKGVHFGRVGVARKGQFIVGGVKEVGWQ
jgi:hypothetical protein